MIAIEILRMDNIRIGLLVMHIVRFWRISGNKIVYKPGSKALLVTEHCIDYTKSTTERSKVNFPVINCSLLALAHQLSKDSTLNPPFLNKFRTNNGNIRLRAFLETIEFYKKYKSDTCWYSSWLHRFIVTKNDFDVSCGFLSQRKQNFHYSGPYLTPYRLYCFINTLQTKRRRAHVNAIVISILNRNMAPIRPWRWFQVFWKPQ